MASLKYHGIDFYRNKNRFHSESIQGNAPSGKNLNGYYAAVMIAYWSSCAIIHGFSTLLLLRRGFTSTQIGIILACSYLAAAFVQPVFASWIDKKSRFSLTQLTAMLGAAEMGAVFLFLISESQKAATILTLLMIYIPIYMLQPVTNSIAVEYAKRGIALNFGIARGLGSGAYAIISTISGKMLDVWPDRSVLLLMAGGAVLMSAAAWGMGSRKAEPSGGIAGRQAPKAAAGGTETGNAGYQAPKAGAAGDRSLSLAAFILAHKKFALLLAGLTALYIYHNMMEGYLYLIMESLGGSASDTGLAIGIAAVAELPPLFLITGLLRRFASGRLLQTAAVGFSLKALLLACARNIGMVYLAMPLQMVGYALFIAASVYYVSELIPAADQLKGQALVTATNTLGGVAGSFLGGLIIERSGIRGMLILGTVISLIGTCTVLLSTEETKNGSLRRHSSRVKCSSVRQKTTPKRAL